MTQFVRWSSHYVETIIQSNNELVGDRILTCYS